MRVLDCVTVQKTESQEVFTVNSASNMDLNATRRDIEAQTKPQTCFQGHSLCWMLGVDLPILLLVLIVIGLFELGVIPSNKAGFYCNDTALSFPYEGDTVSAAVLMSGLLISPVVIFIITESIYTDVETVDSRVSQTLNSAARLFRAYSFGLVANLCVVEVMKGIVGSPRPTFFDLCAPDTAATCKGSEFVPTFVCTSTKYSWWSSMDSYRSFPSGHTSLSVYYALFIAWYLQKRAFNWRNRSILLVPFIQLLTVTFAVVSSLTRITDHRHHWWDVLAGTVIGVVSVVYTVRCLCDHFTFYVLPKSEKLEDCQRISKNLLYDEQVIRS